MKVFAYLTGLTGGAALLTLGQALWSHDFSYMPGAVLAAFVHLFYFKAVQLEAEDD